MIAKIDIRHPTFVFCLGLYHPESIKDRKTDALWKIMWLFLQWQQQMFLLIIEFILFQQLSIFFIINFVCFKKGKIKVH